MSLKCFIRKTLTETKEDKKRKNKNDKKRIKTIRNYFLLLCFVLYYNSLYYVVDEMKDCNITSFLTIKKNKNKLTVRIENIKSCMTYTFFENKNLSFSECLYWQNQKIKDAIKKHIF